MKYLIVTNHSFMLWQFRKELIMQLLKHGEVVISTPFVGQENNFSELGCKCIETDLDRRGMNPLSDYRLYQFYKKIIAEEKPDIVITYSIKPNVYAGMACKILSVSYFANVQGLGSGFEKKVLSTIVKSMYRIALSRVKLVFFENTENAEKFIEWKIIGNDKVKILPGAGVNTTLYSFQPYPAEDNGIHFLYLGRIMKEKGIDEFFAAAKAIKQKYGTKVHFDMVGFFEEEYKDTVETLENEGVIKFHGFQSDPKPYYWMSHCVILPSYHEGMSNVLLEAASCGRAIITTNVPGCKEAVDEGTTGYSCAKGSSEDLISSIEHFLELSYEQRKNMGVEGRNKMLREFDKRKVVQSTFDSISECITGGKKKQI